MWVLLLTEHLHKDTQPSLKILQFISWNFEMVIYLILSLFLDQLNNKMPKKKKYTVTFADQWLLDNHFEDWLQKSEKYSFSWMLLMLWNMSLVIMVKVP